MKSDLLRTLKLAKQSHLEWVVHGARLMVDIDENDAKKPQPSEECSFRVWYEKEGRYITKLSGLKRIVRFHEEFHLAYKALYYKKFNRRVLKKERRIFNKKQNKLSFEETSLRDKFVVLKIRYDALEKEIEALEKIVSVMNEKLFNKDRIRVSS